MSCRKQRSIDLESDLDLRADFVYMAPPFIAYYGALQGGSAGYDLLKLAYTQCKLYRNYLRDDSGLWQHIILGDGTDATHWGTGAAIPSIVPKHRRLTVPCRQCLGCGWHAPRSRDDPPLK